MEEIPSFTIESFYKLVGERKLTAAKCGECKSILLPPRPICPHCYSSNLTWFQLKGMGKLETFTTIHVAPPQFQAITPYMVGIVRLHEGPRLPGMIKNVKPEEVRVGMDLRVDFDTELPSQWPTWPRYFFRPP